MRVKEKGTELTRPPIPIGFFQTSDLFLCLFLVLCLFLWLWFGFLAGPGVCVALPCRRCALEFSDAREKFLRENWLIPVGRLAKYL